MLRADENPHQQGKRDTHEDPTIFAHARLSRSNERQVRPQATYLRRWRARSAENVELDGLPIRNNLAVSTVLIIASSSAAMTAVVVLGLLVWAVRKDGEYDRGVQARLGIRRRTRL
jgi:hypothetical protein